jgi:hypothetical protein
MSCPVTVNECDDDALALNKERSSPLVTVISAGSKKKFDMTTSARGTSEGDALDEVGVDDVDEDVEIDPAAAGADGVSLSDEHAAIATTSTIPTTARALIRPLLVRPDRRSSAVRSREGIRA